MVGKRNVVLFVDDEPHILSAIRRATIDESFEAVFADSGVEALRICDEKEISVIVTDMRMPVMDGLTLLKNVRKKWPRTVRMVLSGYTQISQVLVAINQGEVFQFIPKPWQMEEELFWAVRRGIERYNIEVERDSLQEGLAKKNNAYIRILHEMEQKLINERRDIDGFINVSQWMFRFWKKQLNDRLQDASKEPGDLDNQLQWVEKIHYAYLGLLPTSVEGKPFWQMEEEVSRACSGRIEFRSSIEKDKIFLGCHSFIAMVFQIVAELHEPNKEIAVPVVALVKEQEGGDLFAVFESRPSESAIEKQTLFVTVYELLNAIGTSYNLRLFPIEAEGKIECVRMVWQSQR